MIVSDLHGSSSGMRRIESLIEEEKPNTLILLGDILRGGRDEDPYYVASALQRLSCGILAVKGNCDIYGDDELLNLELPNVRQIPFGHMHTIYLAHHPLGMPLPPGDIFCYGHTHVKHMEKVRGAIYFNPGSISYPRDDGPGYGILTDQKLVLKDAIRGTVIQEFDLD